VAGSEPDFDIVGEGKGVVFGATADGKRWDRFADRIDSQPEPASGGDAANAGIEFIQLKPDEDQVAKELVVPALRMATHAVKLAGDGGVGVTSEADHDGQIETFSEKPEHHFDPLEIGFEVVERCTEARCKDFAASLTLEARNVIIMTVANECMNSIIGDGAVATVGVWAGKAMC